MIKIKKGELIDTMEQWHRTHLHFEIRENQNQQL